MKDKAFRRFLQVTAVRSFDVTIVFLSRKRHMTALLIAFTGVMPAQELNTNYWASYSADQTVKGRWGVHFDTQWRRLESRISWYQFQVRPAVNFRVSPRLQLTAGYLYSHNFAFSDLDNAPLLAEHRIYQQAVFSGRIRKLRVAHRLRAEQRFIGGDPLEARRYQNRFRYQPRVEIPLRGSREAGAAWYVPLSFETLMGTAKERGAFLDQNRIYVGMGRATSGFRTELGYVCQWVVGRSDRPSQLNSTVQVSLSSALPFLRF